MKRLVVSVAFIIFLVIFCFAVVWDYKWNVGSQKSVRYKTGMYMAYFWNRYLDRSMMISNPFMPRARVLFNSERIQGESVAKIRRVTDEGRKGARLEMETGRGQVFNLMVDSLTMFDVDPFYSDFVLVDVVPSGMFRKLNKGMYVRFYVWTKQKGSRLVNDDGRFTDLISDLYAYRVTILKAP